LSYVKKNTTESVIHKGEQIVLEDSIMHCVKEGIEHYDTDKTIDEFTKAVERLIIPFNYSIYNR
jgi:DNA-binding FrmR family transcriptional regulator